MAMDRINGSPLVRQNQLERFQGTDRQRGDAAAGTSSEANPGQAAGLDRAEISETARKLVDLRQAVDIGRAALGRLPDLRDDKVAQARERLATGYYQSPSVSGVVAGRVADVLTALDNA